ncbi:MULTISPECIES: DUF6194 family protein [unclassified Streptomyces]|uniref:DUF6194 family protein n=1 Tax=unclassified Streptomyces TaxID=2593676 RepID=UPI000BAC96ED|nr:MULTISPECIES: DUF6194 family protein [unclassified Streptomyces]ASY36079.1 hypothetical protein CAC01_28120 [Streptomyces sp. CLI2509]MYX21720.1 hypothetical protein [Streptomyces sp. SID8380]
MSIEHILGAVRRLDGALVVVAGPDSGFPPLAHGDAFFFHAPDGHVPARTQPYGTVITKDYPGDSSSRLDAPGRHRVNVHAGRVATRRHAPGGTADPAATDVFFPHPLYGAQGWLSVVNPGPRTTDTLLGLLRTAHEAARARHERRAGPR